MARSLYYSAMMMVNEGLADAVISGATRNYARIVSDPFYRSLEREDVVLPLGSI